MNSEEFGTNKPTIGSLGEGGRKDIKDTFLSKNLS